MAALIPFSVAYKKKIEYGTKHNKTKLPFKTHENVTSYIKALPIKNRHRRLRRFLQRTKVHSYDLPEPGKDKPDGKEHSKNTARDNTKSTKAPTVTLVYVRPQNENPCQNEREESTLKSDTHVISTSQTSTNVNSKYGKQEMQNESHDSRDAAIHRLETMVKRLENEKQVSDESNHRKDAAIHRLETMVKRLENEKQVSDESNHRKDAAIHRLETMVKRLENEKQVSDESNHRKDAAIHRLETMVKRLENEKQAKDQLLKQHKDTVHTLKRSLNHVQETIESLANNPTYLQISGCRNIQIGDGNSQTVTSKSVTDTSRLKQMMESLCNKQKEIEILIKDALENIRDHDSEEVTIHEELQNKIYQINSVLSRKLTMTELKALVHRNVNNDDLIREEERNGDCHIWMPTNELRSMKDNQERLSRSQEELRDDCTGRLENIESAVMRIEKFCCTPLPSVV